MPIIAAPQQLTTFLDIAEALTSKKKTEAAIAEIRKAVRELEDAQMALKAMQENASKLGKADKILADAQVHEQKVSVRERELNERTAELDKTMRDHEKSVGEQKQNLAVETKKLNASIDEFNASVATHVADFEQRKKLLDEQEKRLNALAAKLAADEKSVKERAQRIAEAVR